MNTQKTVQNSNGYLFEQPLIGTATQFERCSAAFPFNEGPMSSIVDEYVSRQNVDTHSLVRFVLFMFT